MRRACLRMVMMTNLRHLITEAEALAGAVTCAAGHAWETEGGRSCPKGLSDGRNPCSQAVYVCARCGAEDYGDAGGPAHRECFTECSREPEPEKYLECRWTPDDPDACPFCAGEACNICGDHPTEPCEHDSLERHEIA